MRESFSPEINIKPDQENQAILAQLKELMNKTESNCLKIIDEDEVKKQIVKAVSGENWSHINRGLIVYLAKVFGVINNEISSGGKSIVFSASKFFIKNNTEKELLLTPSDKNGKKVVNFTYNEKCEAYNSAESTYQIVNFDEMIKKITKLSDLNIFFSNSCKDGRTVNSVSGELSNPKKTNELSNGQIDDIRLACFVGKKIIEENNDAIRSRISLVSDNRFDLTGNQEKDREILEELIFINNEVYNLVIDYLQNHPEIAKRYPEISIRIEPNEFIPIIKCEVSRQDFNIELQAIKRKKPSDLSVFEINHISNIPIPQISLFCSFTIKCRKLREKVFHWIDDRKKDQKTNNPENIDEDTRKDVVKNRDYYLKELGLDIKKMSILSRDDQIKIIKEEFKKYSRLYHPDLHQKSDDKRAAERLMKHVNEAFAYFQEILDFK